MKINLNRAILCLFLFGKIIAQEDFSLKDLNPSSEYFNEFIGPGYFSNNIVIIYFGHEY